MWNTVQLVLNSWLPGIAQVVGLISFSFALFVWRRNIRASKALMTEQSAQTKKLGEILDNVQTLFDRVSTKFIGKFPECLEEITALATSAKTSLYIRMDGVDAGTFCAPQQHARLWHALISALHREPAPLQISFWIDDTPQAVSPASRLSEPCMRSTTEFGAQVEKLIGALPSYAPSFVSQNRTQIDAVKEMSAKSQTQWNQPDAANALGTLQAALHDWEVCQLRANGAEVRINETEAANGAEYRAPDMFYWIADESRVIFMLPCAGTDAMAFVSTDRAYVGHLCKVFKERARLFDQAAAGSAQSA